MDAPNPFAFNRFRTLSIAMGVYTPFSPIEEPKMTDQTSKPSSTKGPRCRHYTDRGRRCQLPVVDPRSGFCFRHAKPQSAPSDSDDLSAELLPELSEFSSGADVGQFLARLLIQVTKGRVSPRRASVLAYITNQLLHSHRAIDRENNPDDDHVNIIMDMPRPDRSQEPDYSPPIQRT
jgi:hypothetical protein